MKKHAAQWFKGLLKYGIGFGLLAVVIYKYWDDNPETGARWTQDSTQRANRLWLAGILRRPRCRGTLDATVSLVHPRSWRSIYHLRSAMPFGLGMVGVFYNTFLPGSVGGDLLKAYFLAKEHPERKTRGGGHCHHGSGTRTVRTGPLHRSARLRGLGGWRPEDCCQPGIAMAHQGDGCDCEHYQSRVPAPRALLPQRRVDRICGPV